MSAYECIVYDDAPSFLERAEAWLLQRESEHNLILGIAAQLAAQPLPRAFLATVEHDGEIVGCAFRTYPHKLGITRMPVGAAEALARVALSVFDDAPSVLGPEAVASIVASWIAAHHGKQIVPGMPQRLYELHDVDFPGNPPPGRLRLAQQSDVEIVTQWLEEFSRETNHGPGDVRSYAISHVANKTMFFWEDEGEARTTALWAATTPNGVRIGFVYTPPRFRGMGYASACVAGASQRALDSGYSFCCLYTDLTNPTSNRIYQNIGYRPVADVMDFNISG